MLFLFVLERSECGGNVVEYTIRSGNANLSLCHRCV